MSEKYHSKLSPTGNPAHVKTSLVIIHIKPRATWNSKRLSNDNRVQLYYDWIKCDGHCFGHFFCHIDVVLMDKLLSHQLERWKHCRIHGILTISTTYLPKTRPSTVVSRWGFQLFFYFHPDPWGRFPIWRLFFRWVGSTTKQFSCFKSLDFQWISSPGEKEILRWGCLHDAQGDFPIRAFVWGYFTLFLLWDEIVGRFFKQTISDIFKCMFISILLQYCSPKTCKKGGVLRFEKNTIDIFSLSIWSSNRWGVALSQHHSGLVTCIRGANCSVIYRK